MYCGTTLVNELYRLARRMSRLAAMSSEALGFGVADGVASRKDVSTDMTDLNAGANVSSTSIDCSQLWYTCMRGSIGDGMHWALPRCASPSMV